MEHWLYTLPLRLRSLFRRRRVQQELDEELQYHLEQRIEDGVARGLTPEQARCAAVRAMDGITRQKEECRDMRRVNAIDNLVRDIRYGARVLRKAPGFTATAALTLALAIGANAVVFGVLNALILRPLNVPRAESLYGIQHAHASMYESYPDYLDLRDRNRSFEGLAAYSIVEVGLDSAGNPARSWGDAVSGNYFDVLSIQPYAGRFFHASDEHGPNSAPFIVLSYGYWHDHFADDGGALGLWGSVVLLGALSHWQPLPKLPMRIPIAPDARVYAVALLLALVSGILFALIPVRQVMRADPYQIVKAGSKGTPGRRLTLRDVLLAAQVAICAVLVTSSLVAVRGMARSLHADLGFQPRNAMLLDTDLNMAGYRGERVPAMQKRMLDAVAGIPGVESVGLVDFLPLFGAYVDVSPVFAEDAADLRPAKALAMPGVYRVSPDYFRAAGTALLSGRTFTWHDDPSAPRVAVVNREFARRILGSAPNAIGRSYKMPDGARIQVVGVVEDGKYGSLTEDRRPVMFLPIGQSPSGGTNLVVRSKRDAGQLAAALRATLHDLDGGLPADIQTWAEELELALFPARMATVSLGVLGAMGAMLAVTGVFGMAAYSVSRRLRELGIRMTLGAQRREVLQAGLGRAVKLLAFGSAAGLVLGILSARVLAAIVYQATPRDPLVLTGVVAAMALLGLAATWIPARRALSLDPAALLREE